MRNVLSRGLIICALASVAGFTPSQAMSYEADGIVYNLACTDDGYVLTPTEGSGKLYLGRSCDAFSKAHGKGTWCWANGGFVAEFSNYRFGFARQELRCPMQATYEDRCGCQ